MKTQTTFNKVVNIADDGEITVLHYVFKHNDGFKGATGSIFYPVSKQQYKGNTTKRAIIERLREYLPEEEIESMGGVNGIYQGMKNNNELEPFAFDTSYSELWDYLREATGLSEKDAFIFECVGGGRCFDKDFQGNVNTELSKIIREYES